MKDIDLDTGGASLLWSSLVPIHTRWRALIDAGDFADAEATARDASFSLADEARDLLARLRWEWSLDADAILAKLRDALGSDISREQLDAWTNSGAIESRIIDGQRRWFRREPRNLILFDPTLLARSKQLKPQPADRHGALSPLISHTVDVVRASEAAPSARELLPVRTRFDFSIVVKPNRPRAQRGSIVRVWFPYPQEVGAQREVALISSVPKSGLIAPADTPQRTVYLEQTIFDPTEPIRFDVSFEYTTSAIVSGAGRMGKSSDRLARYDRDVYLSQRFPHIVFTDAVKRVVAECSADSPDVVTLAKRLWNWVDDHIPWRAEHEYCLIPSIPTQAMALGRGDCGTAALTLISLCRCAGIPARWQSGWVPDPSDGGNMHDWSELYLEPLGGWVPVDASYGKKQHDDPRVRDFFFGNTDRYRLIINTDYGRPLWPAKRSFRTDPVDLQRGEVELDGRNLYYDEWDHTFAFTHRELSAERPAPIEAATA